MKAKVGRLPGQYLAALRRHLEAASQPGLVPAARLGLQAVGLGLTVSDLAWIHRRALTSLLAPGGSARTRARPLRRARAFLAEAIASLAPTPRAALVTEDRIHQLNQTLRAATVELTGSTRHLQADVRQHQAAEEALKKSGRDRTQLLAEARIRQLHLRHQAHLVLSAQERERHALSHQLQDEIGQTLLGINVRLLSLKAAAVGDPAKLKKEIANTQRLVLQSLQSIHRFARQLERHSRA